MCRWNCWKARTGYIGCCRCRQSRPAGHHRSSVMHLLSSFKVNCLLLCTVSDIMTLLTWVKTQHLHTATPSWRVWQCAAQHSTAQHSGVLQHDVHSFRSTTWLLSWVSAVTVDRCTSHLLYDETIYMGIIRCALIIFVCHKLVCLAISLCVIPSFILYSYFVFPSASSASALFGLRQTIELLYMKCSRRVTLVSHTGDS